MSLSFSNALWFLRSLSFFTTHSTSFTLSSTPSLADKLAIITGGSDGVGREITAQLLLHDIGKVYVLSRSRVKFEEAEKEWSSKHSLSSSTIDDRTEFVSCDLSDIQSVKDIADSLRTRLQRLDILILNADPGPTSTYIINPQGFELHFAIQLGHHVLTQLLRPILIETSTTHSSSRIVLTSSSLHILHPFKIDLDSLTSTAPPSHPWGRYWTPLLQPTVDFFHLYARSKLSGILFLRETQRRLAKMGYDNVYCNAFHPGNIPTAAMDSYAEMWGFVPAYLFKLLWQIGGQSVRDAATTAMFLATLADTKGKYFVPVAAEFETVNVAEDKDMQKNMCYWSDTQITKTLGKGWSDVN